MEIKTRKRKLTQFALEIKQTEEYLESMVNDNRLSNQDQQNLQMHLDNINTIVRDLPSPDSRRYELPTPPSETGE